MVVILGKKSSEAKKKAHLFEKEQSAGLAVPKKARFKQMGQKLLHLSEKSLMLLKLLAKKSEETIAKSVSAIRARRSGKKQYESFETGNEKEKFPGSLDSSKREKIISEIGKKENDEKDIFSGRSVDWVSSEVTVKRKKTEELVMQLKEEPAPEDKAKEEALIHRIAENPKDMEAYRELGDYYMSIENIKDAKDSFKMVLKLRPRDLKAKSNLREIEMKMRLGS